MGAYTDKSTSHSQPPRGLEGESQCYYRGVSKSESPHRPSLREYKNSDPATVEESPTAVSKTPVRRSDEPDDSNGAQLYRCEDVNCTWPCHHHLHLKNDKDFFWTEDEEALSDVESFDLKSINSCRFCAVLASIAQTWCTCARIRVGVEKPACSHKYFYAIFLEEKMVEIQGVWTCGGSDLELGIEENQCSSLPLVVIRGHVLEDRSSPEAFGLYLRWIHDCMVNHKKCTSNRARRPPGRVVDCAHPDGVRLTATDANWQEKYLALSYLWGGATQFLTKKENLDQNQILIQWDKLPQLHQDVVILARGLGLRYVWIDALCIVQNDKADKEAEIPRMGDIYQGALLVVVAANTSSPFEGILLDHPERDKKVLTRYSSLWRDTDLVQRGNAIVDGVKYRAKVHTGGSRRDACNAENVAKRGWTYQERLLARRCLIFRDRDVVWECKEECNCDCSGDQSMLDRDRRLRPQLLPPLQSHSNSPASEFFADTTDAYMFWRRAIQVYSSRDLYEPEQNRLPAISALARQVHTATADKYLAGLWRQDLARELTWESAPSYDEFKPYSVYVAPSWSWASTPARTHMYLSPAPGKVGIVDAWCKLAGADEFGPVTDGAIVLEGVYCPGQLFLSTRSAPDRPTLNRPYCVVTLENGTRLDTDGEYGTFNFLDNYVVQPVVMGCPSGKSRNSLQRTKKSEFTAQPDCSGEVVYLWVDEDACLILAYSQQQPGSFERLGILLREMCPEKPDVPPARLKVI